MKKLKLFQKTYLFTMALMGVMIIISHTLLYMLLPTFYINKKQQDLSDISTQLIQQLESNNKDMSSKIAKDFSNKYGINIALNIKNKNYVFEGIKQYDIYIKPESLDSESLIINNNVEFKDSENSSESIENKEGYFKVKNSSLFYKKNIKTLDGTSGSVKIVMDLQSFKEARSVVFMLLPYSIGISLIISLFASYIYAKKITKPIKEICNVTKDMKILKEDAYCDINTGDEIELLSHNIKTPLMSIHIMLENMILNIGKYKNHDIYLPKCKESVLDLSNMVQEILDTSRLNTWNNNKEYEVVNLKNLLENMIEPYKIIAKSKHINMNIDYSNSLIINTDKILLNKVLSNIISNAVNYTDEGKYINIYFENNSLIIENECEPISKNHLEHIFDAFYRAEFDRNKNSGGNGLGLYIVKQILNSLDINYSFDSMENGMKFKITFKNEELI